MTPPVPAALRPYLAGVSGYDISGLEPGTHIGMPSPNLTLIVPLGEPIVVGAAGATPCPYAAMVGGIHPGPVHIHHQGTQRGLQLDLTPAGARALLGVPAAELTGELLGLGDVLPLGRSLAERASEARSWDHRWDLVWQALTAQLEARHAVPARAEVARAWTRIRDSHGRIPVWAVAADVGWSTRHLGEQFRIEYGTTPKMAARLVRFDRSRRLNAARVPLVDIAFRCGYADQAHLNRDWRDFAGTSPGRLEAEDELAFFQDRDGSLP